MRLSSLSRATVQGGAVLFLTAVIVSGCGETGITPADLGTYDYAQNKTPLRCEAGKRTGAAGITDSEASTDGIKFNVRTPGNYDSTIAHPLLMVYAPAGSGAGGTERYTNLTKSGTAAGYVVAYAASRSMSPQTALQLGKIPGQIASKWCIDEKRIFLTGHSDGGTASQAVSVLEKTRHIPAAIAPSAAGFTGADLAEFSCRAPLPVMIMHSVDDELFPGWGAQTVKWWAACNKCEQSAPKKLENGCVAYAGCAGGVSTLYCEGKGGHTQWPAHLSADIIKFFDAAGRRSQ